jgi:hypothetical protein
VLRFKSRRGIPASAHLMRDLAALQREMQYTDFDGRRGETALMMGHDAAAFADAWSMIGKAVRRGEWASTSR